MLFIIIIIIIVLLFPMVWNDTWTKSVVLDLMSWLRSLDIVVSGRPSLFSRETDSQRVFVCVFHSGRKRTAGQNRAGLHSSGTPHDPRRERTSEPPSQRQTVSSPSSHANSEPLG